MKKKLLAAFFSLFAFASTNAQSYLSEDFASGTLPSGWTNDSAGVSAIDLWSFTNPYNRTISGASFDTNFAIFDADQGSSNNNVNEDASLTTPVINISAATVSLFLGFDEQFRGITGTTGSLRSLYYSVDGGTTWVLIDSTQNDIGYPNPAVHTEYDLSAAVGNAGIMIRFNYRGTWDWWWAIDNVSVFQRALCVSPPTAGISVSTSDSVCTSTDFTLNLSGADVAVGLTYQWQSSPDNITYTDITNDTTEMSLGHTQSATTYYRCGVTCSGNTSYSTPVLVSMNPPTECYCVPTFTLGCDALDKVAVNTLLNAGTGCNGNVDNYILYPDTGSLTTTLGTGDTYDFTIASGLGSGTHCAAVWFDFNQDGDFQDSDEYYFISDTIPESSTDIVTPITISNSALLGSTRMRVRYIYNATASQASDCSSQSYGETEDYVVTITVGSGVKENQFNNVVLYPVPASSTLRIAGLPGQTSILLMDQTGRVVRSVSSASSLYEMNVSDLAKGIYMIRLHSNTSEKTMKVVID